MYFNSIIRFLFLLCVFLKLHTQQFIPEITNYTINQYESDTQNWGIDVNDEGVVFIANNASLLIYNGQKWEKYYLPNRTIMRSVLCVGNKVYTGSYGEFGYWTKNYFGTYQYTSLVSRLEKSRTIADEQFWQVFQHEKNIFFKSYSGGVYVYDGAQVNHIDGSYGTYDMCVFKNKILFANREKGILRYKQGKLTSFESLPNLKSFTSVNSIAAHAQKLFFYDLLKGGFLYDKELNTTSSLPNKLNVFLKDNILNKATFVSSTKIALGTIKKGIVIYDLALNTIQNIHQENGIQNNTILGLQSHNKNLWIALDNGISKIDFSLPINFYTEQTGSLGTVYDIAFVENDYYIGSNTGMYALSEDNQIQLVEGLEDHVWDITVAGKELLVGHNNGCFVFKKGKSIRKIDETGVFCSVKIPNSNKQYLQGTYYGISFLSKQNGNWKSVKIEGTSFLVDNIVFESDYVIWVSHPHKGLYRLELDTNYTKVVQSNYYGNYEGFRQHKTNVYKNDDTILFYNSNKWYQYFNVGDSIGKSSQFQKFDDNSLIGKEASGKWFIDRAGNRNISFFDNSDNEVLNIDATEIKSRIVSKHEKIIVKNDSLRVLNLIDGFALFNVNKYEKHDPKHLPSPAIDKVYSRQKQFVVPDNELTVPYEDAQYLSFEIYSPGQYDNNHTYVLSGEISQTALVKGGAFTLQNLNYGEYLLSLTSAGGKSSQKRTEFKFTVLPPWYLSSFFKALYSILFIGLVVGVIGLHRRNLRKHQQKSHKKYVRKMKETISKLEKQNLEKELKGKTTELVGFAEANVEKNEIIMILSNELERTQKGDISKTRIKKVLIAAKNHLKKNKEWNVFKKNFDELNTQFLDKLTNEFPAMTTKDLRLCAYIKTGLTSKEIAPLLGISVRGVEHHRNRVRKKLKLTSNHKLSFFLEHYG